MRRVPSFIWLIVVLVGLSLFGWWWLSREISGVPGVSYREQLPPGTVDGEELSGRLRSHVQRLAGQIGERNWRHREELEQAARYIESTLEDMGYEVLHHDVTTAGERFRNIEAEIAGSGRRDEIFVVGAHYDSAPGSPGADDNASGVAALLEIARHFSAVKPERTVRFVAFVNEEPPFFWTKEMGSCQYARRSRDRGEKVVGMVSLESLGYYKEEPGSQKYPAGLGPFFPDRGDFIGFVANPASRGLLHELVRAFRSSTRFPSEGAVVPGWVTGADWSDHIWFWRMGYPAVMVTDTVPFRNPHYHTPGDVPDTLDYDRMARVVQGLAVSFEEFAGVSGGST